MKNKFKFLIKKKFIKRKSNILDIGSNDGTFLNFFAESGYNNLLYGVDPSAEKFREFYNPNINVSIDFFSKKG